MNDSSEDSELLRGSDPGPGFGIGQEPAGAALGEGAPQAPRQTGSTPYLSPASAKHLALALAAGQMGVFEWDVSAKRLKADANWSQLMGVPHVDGWQSDAVFFELVHPEDRDDLATAIGNTLNLGEPYDHEFRITRPGGQTLWMGGRGDVVGGTLGGGALLAGVNFDITERKAAEEQAHFVASEMGHRVKNLLALVQGISRMSRRGVTSVDEFTARLEGRLSALATLNDLVLNADGRGVSLRQMVDHTVKAVASGGRVEAEVPELTVGSSSAQTLMLALNELATNAVKYGALNSDSGRIALRFEPRHEAGEFRFHWRETGARDVRPPQSTGFGTQVLTQMTAATFEGQPQIDWHPDGLEYSCTWPLREFLAG